MVNHALQAEVGSEVAHGLDCAVVHRGAESRDFDYKGQCSWNPKVEKKTACGLVKDVVALANTAGGEIVIGVDEVDHQFVYTGLSSEQARTWETTEFNKFVNGYIDPEIDCTLRHVQCDGRTFVIIHVPAFSFVPHVTTRNSDVFSQATLYIRTANNNSSAIETAADLYAVVERAIKIRRGEMLEAVLVILPELDAVLATRGIENVSQRERTQVMRRAERAASLLRGAQVLWVDDYPDNNLYERRILRSLGVFVDLARSTDEAMSMLGHTSYNVVISDMERHGQADEGLQLLARMGSAGLRTPTIFYTSFVDYSRGVPPYAFAITDRPDYLLHYVMDVLERVRF